MATKKTPKKAGQGPARLEIPRELWRRCDAARVVDGGANVTAWIIARLEDRLRARRYEGAMTVLLSEGGEQ